MRNPIEVENRIPPEEPLTMSERFHAAAMIIQFDKIKPYLEKSKTYQAQVEQCLRLGIEITDEEQRGKIFDELKRLMIEKLGCKEEWFEESFLRQIRQAHVEQVAAEKEMQEGFKKNKYKN